MTDLLCRLFIKSRDDLASPRVRNAYGSLAGTVGIVCNLLLFAAKLAIGKLSHFLFDTMGLKSSFKELGIDDSNFKLMAEKACGGEAIHGFKTLTPEDVEAILKMCL